MKRHPNDPQPIQFPESNFTYVAPKGMEETCGDLPVFRQPANGENPPLIISCWKFPTRAQRLKFLRDGLMWLTVVSTGQPPVGLTVDSPFSREEKPVEIAADAVLKPLERFGGPPFVIIEVPSQGGFFRHWRNRRFAERCIKDSLARGEAPLLGSDLRSRLGSDAAAALIELSAMTVTYGDESDSDMDLAIALANAVGRPVINREAPRSKVRPFLA